MLTVSKGAGNLSFISWTPAPETDSHEDSVQSAFQQLADYLKSSKTLLLSERLYGLLSSAPSVMQIRKACYESVEDATIVPPTYVEGQPCDDSEFAGIHAIAVRPDGRQSTTPVEYQGNVCGHIFHGSDAEYLFLSDVGRLLPPEARTQPNGDTRETFALAESILKEVDWDFRDVRRTWFYLQDILDWYTDFNQVRNHVFQRFGLLNGNPKTIIPASTGIFGRSRTGGWCTLDLLAMKPTGGRPIDIYRLENPKQNEAPAYGSAFSRGLSISTELSQYVFVSGTASIDENGATIHKGDFERQTERTLENVRELLAVSGAKMEDICQATAFVKEQSDIVNYRRIAERMGLGDVPTVCTVADVCRDDLLFELDATAVLPSSLLSNDD